MNTTMPNRPTGRTGVSLVFGTAVVLAVTLVIACSSDIFRRFHGVGPEWETSGDMMLYQIAPEMEHVATDPLVTNNTHYNNMLSRRDKLQLSLLHQEKFLLNKDSVMEAFSEDFRYKPKTTKFAAIPVSSDFAFLHIWKCGGTTVAKNLGNSQYRLDDPEIQDRDWLTVVRDPIDRYLSAWAECGMRLMNGQITFGGFENQSVLHWLDGDYDERVQAWLLEVQDFLPPAKSCHTHAFPQTNYMMNEDGEIDEHVVIVGDLSELKHNLVVAGAEGSEELDTRQRVGSEDPVKAEYFPSRRHELSDETLLKLCEFYAMDYYLLAFDPPSICTAQGGPLELLLDTNQTSSSD